MGATVKQKAAPQHTGVSFNYSTGEPETLRREGKEVGLLVRSWCGEGEEYEGMEKLSKTTKHPLVIV